MLQLAKYRMLQVAENMNLTIVKLDTTDSTNTEVLRHARLGADEGLCVIARSQTAGRGRYGRTWVSEPDSGLYLSILLRPEIDAFYLPLITMMTAVAVSETLIKIGLQPDIKWANDVMIGEKKIAGILADAAESEHGSAVVVGIGINLRSANFPLEISNIATSVEDELGRRIAVDKIAEILTKKIAKFYDVLQSGGGPEAIIADWRRRSSYFAGKQVRVTLGGELFVGTTDGLEPNGSLRVLADDGRVRIVQSGEVERLRRL